MCVRERGREREGGRERERDREREQERESERRRDRDGERAHILERVKVVVDEERRERLEVLLLLQRGEVYQVDIR